MADIIHRIGVKAPAAKVYEAIATTYGLAHWWTDEVEGEVAVGGEITFTFRAENGDVKGAMVMEVEQAIPNTKLRWSCIEGPEEWLGTTIDFDLSEQDGQAILLFGHRNWREPVEFMAHCSMKWAVFLLSLRQYVETGQGQPSPQDLKIDNWN